MRSADRAEHLDQDVEAADGGQRVGKQRDRHVAVGQALAHDARADHDGQQERGADCLGKKLARKVDHGQLFTMAVSAACKSASVIVSNGKWRSCSMR